MAVQNPTQVNGTTATPGANTRQVAKKDDSPSIAGRFTDSFKRSSIGQDIKSVAETGEHWVSSGIKALKSAVQSTLGWMLSWMHIDSINQDADDDRKDKQKKDAEAAYQAQADAAAQARRAALMSANKRQAATA